MRNLPKPSKDTARDDLKQVLYKYRYRGEDLGYAPTDAEIDAIITIYDRYDKLLGSPSPELKGPNLATDLSAALLKSYGQTYEGGKIHHVRTNAFEKVDLCPMCGIDPPVELDHHLPKSVFKPLAIYALNLVPLCEACNGDKLAADAGKFAHAYFDLLPDVQFLKVDVAVDNGALTTLYWIDDDAGVPVPLLNKIKFQMEALSMNNRFQKDVNKYLVGHTTGIHMAAEFKGSDGVRYYLRKQAQVEEVAFYRNHWRPVLLHALARNAGFCDGEFRNVLPDAQITEQVEDLTANELGRV